MVILLAAKDETLNEFIRITTTNEFFIWGMDSQFVNNNARLPLTVVCCQNERRNTIPGFVALSLKADEQHYSLILQQVIRYIRSVKKITISNPGFLMIDKDSAERNACNNNNLQFLLCQFHIIRTISSKIKKNVKKVEDQKNFLAEKNERSFQFNSSQINYQSVLLIDFCDNKSL
jgi:hypothetical protein